MTAVPHFRRNLSLLAVCWAIVAITRGTGRSSDGAPQERQDPVRLLEERFARGEIDEKEFTERRQVLAGKP